MVDIFLLIINFCKLKNIFFILLINMNNNTNFNIRKADLKDINDRKTVISL